MLGHHFSDCVIGVPLPAIVTVVVVETSFLSHTLTVYFKHFGQDAFFIIMCI